MLCLWAGFGEDFSEAPAKNRCIQKKRSSIMCGLGATFKIPANFSRIAHGLLGDASSRAQLLQKRGNDAKRRLH
jgi:hypothetical protein